MYLFLEEIFFFIKMSQGPYPKAELSRPFEGPVAAAERKEGCLQSCLRGLRLQKESADEREQAGCHLESHWS